ncbi:DMP19 family protein [Arenibacterium sp. CAU 1754]
MLSFFNKKKKTTPVFVSQSAVDASDPYELVYEVAAFWERFENEDFVRPEDLPDGIFDVSCALAYYGAVLNGGHAQFLQNREFCTADYGSIEQVLRRSGNHPMLAIFKKFRGVSGSDPDRALLENKSILEQLTELDVEVYSLQKGEFDFYRLTHDWIGNALDIVVKPSEDIEQFQRTFASRLPGFRDYKLGAYLAPHIRDLGASDLGCFQAAASGMRVDKKPVLIDRATEVPRPDGAPAEVERFFALRTSIGRMHGIQTAERYALCQRTGTAPDFDQSLTAGTGSISEIKKLLGHAQKHDPVLIAHLLLERGDALSGLKRITFYYPCRFGPTQLHHSMAYLVIDQKNRLFRMDVCDLGSGLCADGEDDAPLAMLRKGELQKRMHVLGKQLQVYDNRQSA